MNFDNIPNLIFLISPSTTYVHSIVKIGCMINYSNCCYRTKWVKANSIEYKCGIGVILNVEDDLPQVVYVQDIYIVNENQIAVFLNIFYNI